MWYNKLLLVGAIVAAGVLFASPALSVEWDGSAVVGYNGGPGGTASLAATSLVESFPLGARLGIGYTAVEPGSPTDARRVFINNATNGTPAEQGWRWDYRFDLTYPLSIGAMSGFSVYGGARYSQHTSDFSYIGGNEAFDVTSHQWGWGLGLDKSLRMSARTDFVFTTGVDYYLPGKLEGHDTSYQESGEDVNAREDYAYADADAAINQPTWAFRFMLGLSYRFGK